MNLHALTVAKKNQSKHLAGITNPYNLFLNKSSQPYKSLASQRILFIDFHEFMFSMNDQEVQKLNRSFKKYWSDTKLGESEFTYNDVNLLHDAIHYQLCIRSADGFDIQQVSEDVSQSWSVNQSIAKDYENVDSVKLIGLAKNIICDY